MRTALPSIAGLWGRLLQPMQELESWVKMPLRFAGYPATALLGILILAGFAVLPHAVPGMGLRPVEAVQLRSAFDLLEGKPIDFGIPDESPHARLDALLGRANSLPLLDPEGSLDDFFRKLQAVEGATEDRSSVGLMHPAQEPVHILHYGDSPTTADLITADIRRRLQERFGDAGHGFSLVAPPWVWYQHQGLKISASGWSLASPALGRRSVGMYGLGGVSFVGQTGAHSEVTLKDASHTRVRVYFLKQPEGGTFSVAADGTVVGETSTVSDRAESGSQTFPIPAGTRTVTVHVTSGWVRLFGFEFFKNRPGVVYSSLGLNGGSTEVLSRYMEARHWGEQLRAARPKLVVINYGTNESVYKEYVAKHLEAELRKVVERVREAVPEAAILIMSPMDRGVRDEEGNITTASTIPEVVAIQRKVALDMKVAFFNTFDAMGGAGTMAKWYASNPRLVGGDYIHPMPAGAKLVGDLLFEGLEEQYRLFKLRELRRSMDKSTSDKEKRG